VITLASKAYSKVERLHPRANREGFDMKSLLLSLGMLMMTNPTFAVGNVNKTAFCVFSTNEINHFFSREGLGEMVWSKNSAVDIYKRDSDRGLYFSQFGVPAIYGLDDSGNIRSVMKREPDIVVFPLKELMPGIMVKRNTVSLFGKEHLTFAKRANESMPIPDPNGEFIARCFFGAPGREQYRFKVASIDSPESTLYSGEGALCYIRSTAKAVAILTGYSDGSYDYMEFRRDSGFALIRTLRIAMNELCRQSYALYFADVDQSRNLIAFVEQPVGGPSVIGRPMPRLFLFDLGREKIAVSRSFGYKSGNVYGFFLPEKAVGKLEPILAIRSPELDRIHTGE
jgi:hypothetical protein